VGIAKVSQAPTLWTAGSLWPGVNHRAGLVLDFAKHMGAGRLCVESSLERACVADTQRGPDAGILGCASGMAGKEVCGVFVVACETNMAAEKICPRELDMELLNYWLGALSRRNFGRRKWHGLEGSSPNAPWCSEVAWASKVVGRVVGVMAHVDAMSSAKIVGR
jgi:hypothetical protein